MYPKIDVSKYVDAEGLIKEITKTYPHLSSFIEPWADDSIAIRIAIAEIDELLLCEFITQLAK